MRELALDLGQSGARILLPTGSIVDVPQAAKLPDRSVADSLSLAFAETAEDDRQCDLAALSLTAQRGRVRDIAQIGSLVHLLTGATQVCVMDDGVGWLHAALEGDGVSVAAGTGVVVLARRGALLSHRDGHGPELGDDGGGYNLGREGLRAALRAAAHRDNDTILTDRAQAYLGYPVQELPHADLTRDDLHTLLSGFARHVLDAATDDPVSRTIVEEAGRRLARTALSAGEAVGLRPPTTYAFAGRILRHDMMASIVQAHLARSGPINVVTSESQDALAGALRAARAHPESTGDLLTWWRSQ